MKTIRNVFLASIGTGLAVPAQDTVPSPASDPAPGELDILETADEAGSFVTLAAALKAAGLVEALRAPGPFTVFAPTDDAFAKLPDNALQDLLRPENRDRLRSILQFHVVASRVDAVSALSAGRARTLLGETVSIRLDGGRLRVQDANVVRTDIEAGNGIIHAIDRVLLPPRSAAPRSPIDRSSDLLVLAIDRGVPLFNAGQSEACAAIYEVAVRGVLELAGELPDDAAAALRTGLERANGRNAVDRAWALRFGMDRALGILEHEREASGMTDGAESEIIFDFDDPNEADWRIVNDDVMGGISKSSFRAAGNGTAVFSGRLSLENNGGFASVRSPDGLVDLSGADAVVLRVKGDGRSYAFQALRSDRRGELGYWEFPFQTVKDEWIEVVVPLDGLVHKVMGREIPNGRPLAPSRIGSLAFMIADKNTTPFRLVIDEIRAVRSGS